MVDSEQRLGVPSEPVRYRVFRIGLALSVVVFILTLTPLAYADPPDPTWQLGFFDDDDFDDVVGLITAGVGLVDPTDFASVQPDIILVPAATSIDNQLLVSFRFPSRQPRAPPTA